jgi:flagellar hook assembly protein FlgD
VDDDMEAGYQSVTWNGDDDQGRQVASGIYLFKLNAGDKTFTRKMMMLK